MGVMRQQCEAGGTRTRVLHVLASLGAGGVENWLLHLLRGLDQERFEFHFLLNDGPPGVFEAQARSLGATISRGPEPSAVAPYVRNLRRVLRSDPRYEVVHSHMYAFSGVVLWVAHRAGVPIRVAHSHNTGGDASDGVRRHLMRRLIRRHATAGAGVSEPAMDALYGPAWRDDDRFGVVGMGFDFERFAMPADRNEAKRALGIPPGRSVVGHIGSYTKQKNHPFLLEVFTRLVAAGEDAHLLMLTSPSAAGLRAEVERRGLTDRCVVPETGSDVPRIVAAMDIFLMPSQWEGLGVAAVEAQAGAVPVLASTEVPAEAVVLPELVTRLDLAAGPDLWAAEARRMLAMPRPDLRAAARAAADSRFGLDASVKALERLYRGD